MNLTEFIKSKLEEGVSTDDIALQVLECKELNEETKGLDVQAIADKVYALQKADAIKAHLKQKKDADAAVELKNKEEKALAEKVDSIVAEKLKGINIDPFGKYKTEKDLKIFDPCTKKLIDARNPETFGALKNMIEALSIGDKVSAQSISKEIDAENDKYWNIVNGKAANDPTVTDVTTRGNYAIPTEVDNIITQLTYEKSVMLGLANTVAVMHNSKIYPLMYGMSVSDIADEDTAVTETQPTFANPTVAMKRSGLYHNISNEMIIQKGSEIINAMIIGIASAYAEFLDTRLAIGNVTNGSQLVDGIVFDPNTNAPTAFALSALSIDKIKDIKNTLSDKATGRLAFVANRKVSDKIGLLETTGGNREFPGYIEGRPIAPFGIPLVTNPKITSVLNIGGDAATGGSDDVLICADFDYVYAGISNQTRIDFSEHWRFTNDVTTVRAIKRYGQEVLSATGTGGIVAIAQELTNA